MPSDAPPSRTQICPGCGAVLAQADGRPSHPGASSSCARLFEVTLRGLREDAGTHPATATALRLADAAYDAQHPTAEDQRLRTALELLGVPAEVDPARRPAAWRTTIADVAADLDVIDLPVLVESWARSVGQDWAVAPVRSE
ncbi:DUF5946 family protein [Blastococcus brunescens]|uniref:DUF5946 family protein n=1 Tax=Blastococcus brunescens TaxID=1564165 RepID=A0ABZ1B0B6_9ACTN|nr:DUF5946 family protein [Blastococcus sp. BMG 8361]WRL64257.1 DUF5946 family protein [Blastococcus sp. BMG 8361]